MGLLPVTDHIHVNLSTGDPVQTVQTPPGEGRREIRRENQACSGAVVPVLLYETVSQRRLPGRYPTGGRMSVCRGRTPTTLRRGHKRWARILASFACEQKGLRLKEVELEKERRAAVVVGVEHE